MVKRVIWTNSAELSFNKVLEFLRKNWSLTIADRFNSIVARKIELLRDYPYAGLTSEKKKGYLRILLTKHNSLYYRIKNNELIIVNIHDNRQDPKTAKFN